MMYISDNEALPKNSGFVTLNQSDVLTIVAGTGKYTDYIGKSINSITSLKEIYDWMLTNKDKEKAVDFVGDGFLIRNSGHNNQSNYIYIEGNKEIYDFELIQLFLSSYSVALDNYILNNMIFSSQKEIIITLGK